MLDLTRSNQKLIRPSSGCKQSNRSAILICRRQMDRLFKYKILAFQVHQLPSYSVFPQNSNFPGEKFSRGKNFPKETFFFPAVTFLSQGEKTVVDRQQNVTVSIFFGFHGKFPGKKKVLFPYQIISQILACFIFPGKQNVRVGKIRGKKPQCSLTKLLKYPLLKYPYPNQKSTLSILSNLKILPLCLI